MSVLEDNEDFVTTALYVEGHELRFFAPLNDISAVAATLLAWIGVKKERMLSNEVVYTEASDVSEDNWYKKAKAYYATALAELQSKGLTLAQFKLLDEVYFAVDKSAEIRSRIKNNWAIPDVT